MCNDPRHFQSGVPVIRTALSRCWSGVNVLKYFGKARVDCYRALGWCQQCPRSLWKDRKLYSSNWTFQPWCMPCNVSKPWLRIISTGLAVGGHACGMSARRAIKSAKAWLSDLSKRWSWDLGCAKNYLTSLIWLKDCLGWLLFLFNVKPVRFIMTNPDEWGQHWIGPSYIFCDSNAQCGYSQFVGSHLKPALAGC